MKFPLLSSAQNRDPLVKISFIEQMRFDPGIDFSAELL